MQFTTIHRNIEIEHSKGSHWITALIEQCNSAQESTQ
jgi:hypothetical protein